MLMATDIKKEKIHNYYIFGCLVDNKSNHNGTSIRRLSLLYKDTDTKQQNIKVIIAHLIV